MIYKSENAPKESEKGCYHAVSLSGGKDSTAMLLLMIERDMPIDIVLSADTGMEFPEMYEHLAKVDAFLYEKRNIHITTLRHPKGFEWLMFEEPKQKPSAIERRLRDGVPLYGNGWPGIRVRWCTGQLKTHLITKKVNELKGKYHALHYVGIAYDERNRCKCEQYPLVDWKITEAEALKICYDRGFDFGACMRFIIGHPAGAVHSNGLMNCVSCGNIIPNCGNICGRWITGHWNNLAPAR